VKEKIIIVITCMIALNLGSCNRQESLYENQDKVGTLLELKPQVSQLELPLDRYTSNILMKNLQYFEENGNGILLQVNHEPPILSYYDLSSKNVINRINLFDEGPKRIKKLSYLLRHNSDSFFAFNTSNRTITLLDRNLEIAQKYQLEEPFVRIGDEITPYHPYVVASLNPHYSAGNLIFPSSEIFWFDDVNKMRYSRKFRVFNLKDHNQKVGVPYPDFYKDKLWHFLSYNLSSTFNTSNNQLIVSFPLNDSINVYDFDLNLIGSYLAKPEIDFYPKSMSADEKRKDKGMNYLTQNAYSFILYDRWKNLYYRFWNEALDESTAKEVLDAREYYSLVDYKPTRILVLDSSFNTIGNYTLTNKLGEFSGRHSFVSPDGLNILWPNHDNQDVLRFKTLDFQVK
jgi:hypothetical protein